MFGIDRFASHFPELHSPFSPLLSPPLAAPADDVAAGITGVWTVIVDSLSIVVEKGVGECANSFQRVGFACYG